METKTLDLDTSERRLLDLNDEVRRFCASFADGLLSIFVPHATAGLAILELGAGSEDDLEDLLGRLLPKDDRYHHRHGSPGHGADHLLPVLLAPSVTIPVVGGGPVLGTWQHVTLVDLNPDNPHRRVCLSFLPEP